MKNFEKNIDLFDAYLEGTLTTEEQTAFAKRLESDSDFNKEFNVYQSIIKGVIKEENNQIKLAAKELIQSKKTQSKNTKLIDMSNQTNKPASGRRFFLIAASFLLLAGAFYLFTSNSSQALDLNQVMADNYTKESPFTNDKLDALASSGFAKGTESDSAAMADYKGLTPEELEAKRLAEQYRVDTLTNGLMYFKKAKWADAKKMLYKYTERYAEPIADYQSALYHYAKSAMNNGDYQVAAESFNRFLEQSQDNAINQEAQYELALCNLHINTKDAKDLLDKIAGNNGHKHQDSAKGLLTIL